jgi:hypothetical protein
MEIRDFISRLKKEGIYKYVYHFTDYSNLAGITKHGLLCKARLDELGMTPEFTGGDAESLASDMRLGNNRYVSLSLSPQHPMAHDCRLDGRHPDQIIIPIDPEVLLTPESKICLGLANSSATPRFPLAQGLGFIDFDVFYTKHNKSFSEVKEIVLQIRKFEVLIPDGIAPNYLGPFFRPKVK